MLLLWQHVHTLPIGKMIQVAQQNSKRLKLISAIVDVNELAHDAAVMVDNDMARFSHGFRALEFTEIKGDGEDGPSGFDVKRFEIMEESMVSVPANPDADTDEVMLSLVEGGKLTSPLMREVGKTIRDRRAVSVPVNLDVKLTINGREVCDEDERRAGGTADKGVDAGTPKEADVDIKGEGAEKEKAADAEVKGHYTDMVGSWEWIQNKLRSKAKAYLAVAGVSIGEKDWTYLPATYDDYVIVCVEKPQGGEDEYRYFKIGWEIKDNEPAYVGEPEQVKIELTTEMMETSPLYWQKQGAKPFPNEHACRLRSPGDFEDGSFRRVKRKHDGKEYSVIMGKLDGETTMTDQAFRYAKTKWDADDAKAHCKDHGGKFEAAAQESSVQNEIKETTVEQAMAIVITKATTEQKQKMAELLKALQSVEDQRRTTEQYRALQVRH